MEHHHKIVGFTFAYLGASLIDESSHQLFRYDIDPLRDGDKLFVGSVFILLFALVQLITSCYLAYKEKFLKFWSFIHAALVLVYFIVFFVLVASTSDIAVRRAYFPGLIQNNLFLIVVIVFNLAHEQIPSFG